MKIWGKYVVTRHIMSAANATLNTAPGATEVADESGVDGTPPPGVRGMTPTRQGRRQWRGAPRGRSPLSRVDADGPGAEKTSTSTEPWLARTAKVRSQPR